MRVNIELSIIVPCYNESEVVEKFFSAMVGNNGILNKSIDLFTRKFGLNVNKKLLINI